MNRGGGQQPSATGLDPWPPGELPPLRGGNVPTTPGQNQPSNPSAAAGRSAHRARMSGRRRGCAGQLPGCPRRLAGSVPGRARAFLGILRAPGRAGRFTVRDGRERYPSSGRSTDGREPEPTSCSAHPWRDRSRPPPPGQEHPLNRSAAAGVPGASGPGVRAVTGGVAGRTPGRRRTSAGGAPGSCRAGPGPWPGVLLVGAGVPGESFEGPGGLGAMVKGTGVGATCVAGGYGRGSRPVDRPGRGCRSGTGRRRRPTPGGEQLQAAETRGHQQSPSPVAGP